MTPTERNELAALARKQREKGLWVVNEQARQKRVRFVNDNERQVRIRQQGLERWKRWNSLTVAWDLGSTFQLDALTPTKPSTLLPASTPLAGFLFFSACTRQPWAP